MSISPFFQPFDYFLFVENQLGKDFVFDPEVQGDGGGDYENANFDRPGIDLVADDEYQKESRHWGIGKEKKNVSYNLFEDCQLLLLSRFGS